MRTTVAETGQEIPRTIWWTTVVLAAVSFGFVFGYDMSSRTPIQPGYFDKPEAGGYGVAKGGSGADKKLSDDLRKYYEGLAK